MIEDFFKAHFIFFWGGEWWDIKGITINFIYDLLCTSISISIFLFFRYHFTVEK